MVKGNSAAELAPEVTLLEQVDSFPVDEAKAALQRYRDVLKESKKNGNHQKAAWTLVQMAMVLRGQRQYDTAIQLLGKAREKFEAISHSLGLAIVNHELSVANREMVRNVLALEYAHKSIRLLQELGRRVELAWAYDNMAQICFNTFRRSESLSYAKKARVVFSELKSQPGLAWNSCMLAWIYLEMGFYAEADQYFSEALKIFTSRKNQQGIAWSLLGLGIVRRNQCKFSAAEGLILKAKALYKELRLTDREGYCLLNEAAVKRAVGKSEDALLVNKRAIQLFAPLRHQDGLAWALFQIGQIYRDRGQFIKAWQTLRESLNLHIDISNRKGMGWASNEAGRVYLQLNDMSHARESFIKAKVIADQLDDGPLKVDVEKNLAALHLDEGLLQKSFELLAHSEWLCEKIKSRETEVEVYFERARYYLMIGEIKRARECVEAADTMIETSDLYRLKPRTGVCLGEIMALQNKPKSAWSQFDEALKTSEVYQQKRPRVEAMLGLAQLLIAGKSFRQAQALLNQVEKDLRILSSRKLKAKYLLIKGLLIRQTDPSAAFKFFEQAVSVVNTAGLAVLEKQFLEIIERLNGQTGFLAGNGGFKPSHKSAQEMLKALLDRGPADLYLVRFIVAPETSLLPVSITA